MGRYLCLCIVRLNVKMSVLFRAVYRFNTIPISIPTAVFAEIKKLILKFMWNCKNKTKQNHKPQIAETIFKENGFGRPTLLNFESCYRVTFQKVGCLHRYRHMDQWNRIGIPEIKPYLYGQLIFNKGTKSIQWGKSSLFTRWYWDNQSSTCRE